MNKKLLLVAAAAVLSSVLAVTAKAQSDMQPRLPGPFGCLDMSASMPALDAKRGVLVSLRRHLKSANGPLLTNYGMALNWFRAGKATVQVGMAHPMCWTFIPIKPSRLNYRYHSRHPSILCAQEQGGDYPATDPKYTPGSKGDAVKYGACPRVVWRTTTSTDGTTVHWATIIYEVVYDPARYLGQG